MQGANRKRDKVIIFANGVIADMDAVRPWLDEARAVIAADGGLRYALAFGRTPDVLIGDLDSLPAGFEPEAAGEAIAIIRYPTDKDETDLELALLHAVEHYSGAELIVLGGIGGRLDQTLANILLMAHPLLEGVAVRLVEGVETAWLITGEGVIEGRVGDTVSLIPIGGPAHILATEGLRWPLHDELLVFGPARGISNRLTAERAVVRLSTGVLLCIHTRMS
ncbi:MAG TPA: thiamine diphosphokinase [Promineifilum sp.]|nr:thiamine diphosphokinase [Promineifilum sp.]